MITTRTPFRVSFLGGGTDFPNWYRKHGGICIGAAINRYSYVTARNLPPFHKYHSKFVYSQMDCCHHNTSVSHKGIRAVLQHLGLGHPDSPGLEVFHAADLPGMSGTGSSSTFIVGLINALASLQGKLMLPGELARKAIYIEQTALEEVVGSQDQTWAAYGGLNVIRFMKDGEIAVFPLALSTEHIKELNSHLLLFFTKIDRISSHVAATYAPTIEQKEREQWAMIRLAEQGVTAIQNKRWETLGGLIDQGWRIKSGLSTAVTNDNIDNLYAAARLSGAFGGKITGAGGGGCLFLVAPPEKHEDIIETLGQLGCVHIPFGFDFHGSRVIYSSGELLKEDHDECR